MTALWLTMAAIECDEAYNLGFRNGIIGTLGVLAVLAIVIGATWYIARKG